MDSLQAKHQPRLSAEPMDAGDVLVLVLCVGYMLAAMVASVYLVCHGEARMGVFAFVALWLRELVLLVLLAVGLLVAAALKVSNALGNLFRTWKTQGAFGENAP